MKPRKLLILFCLLLPAWIGAGGQTLVLEEKSKYEKFIEQKTNENLLKLFGPGKAKVSVQVEMDFKVEEKVQSDSASDKSRDNIYKWYQNEEKNILESGGDNLMPGFPTASPLNPYKNDNQSYTKMLSFPSSIKRMIVTLIVDSSLTEPEILNVQDVVSNILGVKPERGDEMVLVKTAFAPLWKTVWYSPESMAMLFKYLLIAMVSIIGIIAATIGFLNLSKSMNNMAKMQGQNYNVGMEFSGADKERGGAGGLLEAEGIKGPAGEKGGEEGQEGAEVKNIAINVEKEKIPYLVHMLSKESPDNIAIVVDLLPEENKQYFLKMVPEDVLTSIVASMAKVRFVDDEKLMMIKEGVEKRMKGTFGGVEKALEIMRSLDFKKKKMMLDAVKDGSPELYKKARSLFVFAEDLPKLKDKDIAILYSEVKMDDWLNALWKMDKGFVDKLKKQLTENAWKVIEQSMRYDRPPEEKIDKSLEKVLEKVADLANSGKITKVNEEAASDKARVGYEKSDAK